MKNRYKQLWKSFLLGLLLSLVPASVKAATTINSPTGGECLKGGSTVSVAWTQDSAANHSYTALWQGSSQPTYFNGQPHNLGSTGGHFANSPISWTTPTTTAGGYQIYVESHNPGHSNVSTATSGSFSIDSSGPGAPTLTATTTNSTSISLSWTAASDAGCKGLEGYKVYRGGALLATITATTYQDTGLSPGTAYSYSVLAFDSFDSTTSNSTSATTAAASSGGGTTQPTTPTPTETTPTPTEEKPAETKPDEQAQPDSSDSTISINGNSEYQEARAGAAAKPNKSSAKTAIGVGAVTTGSLGSGLFYFLRIRPSRPKLPIQPIAGAPPEPLAAPPPQALASEPVLPPPPPPDPEPVGPPTGIITPTNPPLNPIQF